MKIFVTGDTHGSIGFSLNPSGGYMNRLNECNFPEQSGLGKEDLFVILGDFGGIWLNDRVSTREPENERSSLEWLDERPFTTLIIPGNHENYDRIMGCRNESLLGSWYYQEMPETEKEKMRQGYPRVFWNGGFVRAIRPSVLVLERGYVYQVGGVSFFAFGGALSHDIQDGILDPADYASEKEFYIAEYKAACLKVRIKGVSWWPEELPSGAEMKRGRQNLRKFLREHGHVDYIFTHEAPAADLPALGVGSDNPLSRYLDEVRRKTTYGSWYYGHYHINQAMGKNRYVLYEEIRRIY